MALHPGTRLGAYEITAQIGAGGMGEVYEATDTNLGRRVAIKVLPEAVATDAERLVRFDREAKTLAALNHPNIAHIYGLERADPSTLREPQGRPEQGRGTTGSGQAGFTALVMELVDGPTLADRIAQGSIPVDEAVLIARQIAEALEAAHEQGIIHRDLKPSNIKLRPDGAVKVLDFGLAKAMDSSPGQRPDLSMSPTITTPAMTHAGFILGTAPYMSPEQAKGKPADRRADIWAFGVVLCEMLTGTQLFTGETATETLASVIKDEPKLDTLPVHLLPIVERCLRRDVRKRWQAIGDVRIALEEGVAATAPRPASSPSRFRATATLAWIVASVAVTGAGALAFVHFRETPPARIGVRFQVAPPEKSVLGAFAVSPDGRHLAFVGVQGGRQQLWVRPVDSLDARALPGTDGVLSGPNLIFWSPDSRFIGFVGQGKLKKVSVAGAPPQTLADNANSQTRATWGRAGVILLGLGPGGPIQRLPESGGVPVAVTTPAAGEGHYTPQFLPDGQHFLYSVRGGKPESDGIYVSSLEDGAQPIRLLPDATVARYAQPPTSGGSGHLLFVRGATLMAQPFDPETPRVIGEVFPVAESVTQFSVSDSGELAYTSGARQARQELLWLDRSGKPIASAGPSGEYGNFRLSPDEKSIVFNRGDAENVDIWVLDMARGVPSRISFAPNTDNLPIWSHDGLRILWPSRRNGLFDLYVKAATGAGEDELFIKMGTSFGWATDWSRDGKFVLYERPGESGEADLWIAPQSPERSRIEQKPVPYLQSTFKEENAVFSPDGRWIAYVSDESGREEVYVQAFPLTNEKDRVSSGGGTNPAWRSDGTELFYLAADRNLMAVPVRASATAFEPGAAQVLFPIPGNLTRRAYAPSGDGRRFLITRPMDESTTVPITVVLNWQTAVAE